MSSSITLGDVRSLFGSFLSIGDVSGSEKTYVLNDLVYNKQHTWFDSNNPSYCIPPPPSRHPPPFIRDRSVSRDSVGLEMYGVSLKACNNATAFLFTSH